VFCLFPIGDYNLDIAKKRVYRQAARRSSLNFVKVICSSQRSFSNKSVGASPIGKPFPSFLATPPGCRPAGTRHRLCLKYCTPISSHFLRVSTTEYFGDATLSHQEKQRAFVDDMLSAEVCLTAKTAVLCGHSPLKKRAHFLAGFAVTAKGPNGSVF
jgi:hypothetical protein